MSRPEQLLDTLAASLPDATIALRFTSTWELLAATMLSAQSTDVKVNEVTAVLFVRYPNVRAIAEATQEEIETVIGSLGLFRQKAKHLRATAALILTQHDGTVPSTMEELLAFPGVARKTANVVLSNGFGINEGVVVDTHVKRIATRLGLTAATDVNRIEQDLMRQYPKERWLQISDVFIHHGRRVCDARRPRCELCVVASDCPSSAAPTHKLG
ncbi:MAG: endonuclease III [Nitriliruptoraceae bacterium]